MIRSLSAVCAILATFALAACSRQQAIGGDTQGGRQRIYALTEAEADAVAHGSIVASFPGRRIETINGPVRGYSTYIRMVLDTFTQQVVIKPVTGRRADGSTVDGYTFDVSGSGTAVIAGNAANANFGNTLQNAADATGKAVEVVSIAPRAITATRPAAPPEGNDASRQLQTLRNLLDQGLISGTEYEAKRREILRRL